MSNGNSEHSRLQLNNLLQRSYGTGALQWQCYQTGPQHISPWIAIAYINGVEYGRGQGHTQGAAKEQAAAAAYNGFHIAAAADNYVSSQLNGLGHVFLTLITASLKGWTLLKTRFVITVDQLALIAATEQTKALNERSDTYEEIHYTVWHSIPFIELPLTPPSKGSRERGSASPLDRATVMARKHDPRPQARFSRRVGASAMKKALQSVEATDPLVEGSSLTFARPRAVSNIQLSSTLAEHANEIGVSHTLQLRQNNPSRGGRARPATQQRTRERTMNNDLQATDQAHALVWVDSKAGPDHQPVWTSVCKRHMGYRIGEDGLLGFGSIAAPLKLGKACIDDYHVQGRSDVLHVKYKVLSDPQGNIARLQDHGLDNAGTAYRSITAL
ncbi:hypothetical protein BC629DRAFT_1440418 [Irpex lacteus]|nr:hypothetical protein BC629DRAFT_1440418 [Irpex lacteus]